MTLVAQRKHSIVAFNWKHERDSLIEIANREKITYEAIDGSVPAHKKKILYKDFKLDNCKYCSVTHNLLSWTYLTKATTAIWCSPTYSAEQFQQFNRRIHRAGQNKNRNYFNSCKRYLGKTCIKNNGKLERWRIFSIY